MGNQDCVYVFTRWKPGAVPGPLMVHDFGDGTTIDCMPMFLYELAHSALVDGKDLAIKEMQLIRLKPAAFRQRLMLRLKNIAAQNNYHAAWAGKMCAEMMAAKVLEPEFLELKN